MSCDLCDFPIKTYEELNMHRKVYHSLNKASQYESCSFFEPFKCFYCDENIDDEDELDDHRIECAKELDFMYCEWKSFECECCGAECRDNDDLRRHSLMYHTMESEPQEIEKDKFLCDICPLIYKKKVDLDFHKRGFHWGQL